MQEKEKKALDRLAKQNPTMNVDCGSLGKVVNKREGMKMLMFQGLSKERPL